MKIFDYEKSGYCKERKDWLKVNHNKTLTEELFVKEWVGLREFSQAKHKGSKNSPSNARSIYRSLKKSFGFFA